MPGFQFELSQLVNVPGSEALQGRVCARMEYVGKPSIYQVTWLKPDLDVGFEVFSEAGMLEAQKPKPTGTMTVKVEADTSEVDAKIAATTASAQKLRETADQALDSLSRLPRNVLNLRRSATRSKRK